MNLQRFAQCGDAADKVAGKEENTDEAEAVMPQAEGGIGAIDSKEGDASQGYGGKCNGNCGCDTAFAARSPFH